MTPPGRLCERGLDPLMRGLFLTLLAATLALGACHDAQTSQPTPLPNAASLIPEAPARPSPTPTPPEDPLPANPGGGGGGGGGGGTNAPVTACGEPAPPTISRFAVKVYSQSGDHAVLDSTPLVGPDVLYCRQIGYTDGRSFCPVRPDGNPQRVACEAAAGVGYASDTGRVGPTWTADGRPCSGSGPGAYCINHGANQFQVLAYGSGTFSACAQNGVCGQVVLQ